MALTWVGCAHEADQWKERIKEFITYLASIGSVSPSSRWLRWVGADGRRRFPPGGIDLLLDERRSKDPLRGQTVVGTAVKPEQPLGVAAMQSKGPQVLDLESRSRSTPGPVRTSVFALVACPRVDPLANL